MRNAIIKILGGYTESEFRLASKRSAAIFNTGKIEGLVCAKTEIIEQRNKTLKQKKWSAGLQASLENVLGMIVEIEEMRP